MSQPDIDPAIASIRLDAFRLAVHAFEAGVSLGDKTMLQCAREIAAWAEGVQ